VNKLLHNLIDPKDGGMASRKFVFAVGTSALIFLGGMIAAHWVAFTTSYDAMISGLLGCLGLYLGGNVTSKFMMAKQMKAAADAPAEVDDEEKGHA
jgi:hypothetical protein